MRRGDGYPRKDSKLHARFFEVIEMYESGMSTTEIAKEIGVDASNVYRVLVSRGVKMRSRSASVKNAYRRGRGNFATGSDCTGWKGGEHIRADGRTIINQDRSYKYRKIMENHIGRPLTDNEVVHHRNHDVEDNRIENLQLMTKSEHAKLHAEEQGNLIGINHWKFSD